MLGKPKLKGVVGRKHVIEEPTTLRQFLAEISPEVKIAVGAGSGFLYIGSVQTMPAIVPFLDFHGQYATTKYFYGQRIYNEYTPLMQRQVKRYWARRAPDEDAMWVVEVEGKENGVLWCESEAPKMLSKMKNEFVRMMEYDLKRLKENYRKGGGQDEQPEEG